MAHTRVTLKARFSGALFWAEYEDIIIPLQLHDHVAIASIPKVATRLEALRERYSVVEIHCEDMH